MKHVDGDPRPPNDTLVFQLQLFLKRGLIRYTSFERTVEAIRINGDVAIVMGAETVVPKGEAPRAGQTVHRRFTTIWAKDGSTWRAIARHANVILDEKKTLDR